MRFIYGQQDMPDLLRAQETCCLVTNGLGGYASVSAAFSVSRGDQGILVSAKTAPNERITLVHRLRETLTVGGREWFLSSQEFGDKTPEEDGFRWLTSFDNTPAWHYAVAGVSIDRFLAMEHEENTTAVVYTLTNETGEKCTLRVNPRFLCAPKGESIRRKKICVSGNLVSFGGYCVYVHSSAGVTETEADWENLYYRDDAKDGRRKRGTNFGCLVTEVTAQPGETVHLELVFSDKPCKKPAAAIVEAYQTRQKKLFAEAPFQSEAAKMLAVSADGFLARRDSTGGKTILAGYPFFGDWGRDTMIALPGCTLATGQYETAKSILSTFLAYEKDGLVPNLFPEGNSQPMYNTVDAALLLINSVYLYHQRTGDDGFLREAYPVMERIMKAYQSGTHHGIGMDADGLIRAGEGLDQVTWMDVRVGDILPTPRHGKPVEINAYWYNALKIMAELAPKLGCRGEAYAALSQVVKKSFREKFWMPEGYLKDVLSGTAADTQIRCNQIWALTMPFTMLEPSEEQQVLDTVTRELYTPCGLRTLSPRDPEFQPTYGGVQLQRDLAYHQGTVWVFPMGAYYRAVLKLGGKEAAIKVRRQLDAIIPMLREGCVGQLPEIYSGLHPGASQGCFAQAWSVGEMLTVYEMLENVK